MICEIVPQVGKIIFELIVAFDREWFCVNFSGGPSFCFFGGSKGNQKNLFENVDMQKFDSEAEYFFSMVRFFFLLEFSFFPEKLVGGAGTALFFSTRLI